MTSVDCGESMSCSVRSKLTLISLLRRSGVVRRSRTVLDGCRVTSSIVTASSETKNASCASRKALRRRQPPRSGHGLSPSQSTTSPRAFEASGQPADGGGAAEFGDGKAHRRGPRLVVTMPSSPSSVTTLVAWEYDTLSLLRNYPGTGGGIGVEYGQPHDDAQSQIGELRQLHDLNLHNSHLR